MPKFFFYVWLPISTLLNVVGLASICDDLIAWTGIIREYLDFYQYYIRSPVQSALSRIWLDFFVEMPSWFADYFVILSTYLTALTLHSLAEKEESANLQDRKHNSKVSGFMIIKGVLIFPLLIYLFIKAKLTARRAKGFARIGAAQAPALILLVLALVIVFYFMILLLPVLHLFTTLFALAIYGKMPGGMYRTFNAYLLATFLLLGILIVINSQISKVCTRAENLERMICAFYS